MEQTKVVMEVIKGNKTNLKIRCSCSSEFWFGTTKVTSLPKCPDCNGEFGSWVRYFAVRVQSAINTDFMTIAVLKALTPGQVIKSLMDQSSLVFHLSASFKVEEITREMFDSTDQERVGKDCLYYLGILRSIA